jgi:hypothetical protein
MRFMVIVKATKDSENEGVPPDPQLMADMNKFNDELLEAGPIFLGAHRSERPLLPRRAGALWEDLYSSGGTGKAEHAKPPGAGIWPEAVPRKMRGRKRELTEISEYRGERWTRTN